MAISNVEHKLARKIRGFIVVRRNANVAVYEDLTVVPPTDTTKFIRLRTGSTALVSLWVF